MLGEEDEDEVESSTGVRGGMLLKETWRYEGEYGFDGWKVLAVGEAELGGVGYVWAVAVLKVVDAVGVCEREEDGLSGFAVVVDLK